MKTEVLDDPIVSAVAMAKPSPANLDPLIKFMAVLNKEAHAIEDIDLMQNLTTREIKNVSVIKEVISNTGQMADDITSAALRHQFPVLPLKPLRWRDKDGWPVLVPFSLDSPIFSFDLTIYRIGGFDTCNIKPELPDCIASACLTLNEEKYE